MGNVRRTVWWAVAAFVLLLVVGLVTTAEMARSATTKRVTFRGYKVEVPASWPVVDLAKDPTACVRFDVHAVYLGHPGANQSCPAHLVGRTEALLIEPLDKTSKGRVRSDTVWAPKGTGAATIPAPTDQEVTVGVTQAGVLVTGSYGDDRATLAEIVGDATLTEDAQPATELAATTSTAATVLLPGTFHGEGFDACEAPASSTMRQSPYRAANIYIGGVARACDQPNLDAAWVSEQVSAGWALIPTYVGLQAPCTGFLNKIDPTKVQTQGRQAAEDAVVQAGALGIGPGSVVYFDMEGYSTTDPACTDTVLAFLSNWSTRLHELGYLSGVYSSLGSGIRDLVNVYGDSSFVRPDHIWFARWNGDATVSDPAIPETFWADHQRIKQYAGGVNETWGTVTINIDKDFLDVETPEPPPPPPVDDGDQDRPAAVTLGSELHVFARGTDNRVYEAFYRSGAWSSWVAIGNLTTQGSPSAVVYGTGINLYARGTDQRLYETYYRPGKGWSRWGVHAGLSVAGDPSAIIYGTSGINVYVRGTDQRLYETYFRPTTRWSGWAAHAGVAVAGDPATVVLGTEVHVFERGVDGGLYETFYQRGFGWSEWQPHAGVTVDGDPAAVVYGTGINLFARGADQRLYETYLRASGWSRWGSRGGTLAGDPAALVVGTEIHVFARTTANLMAETFFRSGAGWSAWASRAGRTIAGTPAAVRYGTSGINVYARGTDHHLYETYFRPASGWSAWHVKGGTAVAIA
ncbi:MAG TPA: glycoside hydrolase domain-containing protein [Actinomycetes bacterium]|nr:glycoside hydrolase domain-containing protein [Actinomycetes bacterium]